MKEETLKTMSEILNILLDFYKEAKSQKAYDKVDMIRVS
jgi:cysteinyl-tRNA synthetase